MAKSLENYPTEKAIKKRKNRKAFCSVANDFCSSIRRRDAEISEIIVVEKAVEGEDSFAARPAHFERSY
jgi:hypothetical protein